jgi:ParB family chromosome partitioning protein
MASFKERMRSQVADSMQDRLGRGVDPAAGAAGARPALEREGEGRRRLDAACTIRLDRIAPDPDQPRKEFDETSLDLLAESLRARGQLQPIRVRWDGAIDRYIVVVGERRYRAALRAGMEAVACVVVPGQPSAEDLLEDQLVENALREDLKPIEQARAYRALLNARSLSQRELAERLQIGHASIARALALLELPVTIQESVDQGRIAPNTAYEISKIDDPQAQAELAHEAAEGRLRRDEVKARGGISGKGKGRGAARGTIARAAMSKVVRTSSARITIELKKGTGPHAFLAAAEEAVRRLRAEIDDRRDDVEAA